MIPDGMSYKAFLNKAVIAKYCNHPTIKIGDWFTLHTAVRREKTKKLWIAQGGKCAHCQKMTVLSEDVGLGKTPRNLATLDHIIPQVEGGTDSMRNLLMACRDCNSSRGCLPVGQFRKTRPVKAKLPSPEKLQKAFERRMLFVFNIALVLFIQDRYGQEQRV